TEQIWVCLPVILAIPPRATVRRQAIPALRLRVTPRAILSPAILSPAILSPAILSPAILSPALRRSPPQAALQAIRLRSTTRSRALPSLCPLRDTDRAALRRRRLRRFRKPRAVRNAARTIRRRPSSAPSAAHSWVSRV